VQPASPPNEERSMAARTRRKKKTRDWKLVLADIRRTELELAEVQDMVANFRETLDTAKRRLAFVRVCVEKRAKEKQKS
jgi:hypothetical protein